MTRFAGGWAAGLLFLSALEVVPDYVRLFVKHEPKASASCVANQVKGFTSQVREEFPHLMSRMQTLWSSSLFFVAYLGVVSADTVEKYISTQWEGPWAKRQQEGEGGRAPGV